MKVKDIRDAVFDALVGTREGRHQFPASRRICCKPARRLACEMRTADTMMADAAKQDRDRQFHEEALRWLPDVTRYALFLARDESDANDLVQETFLKAYRSWESYTPGTECRGWLFTICRNAFVRGRKREERQVVCDDPELEALAASAVHASAQQGGYGDLFSRFDLSDAITRAIDALPEPFREVVVLIDVLDESYDSAAETLAVPIGTVRSRLFRARRLLQEALISHARDAGLVAAPSKREPNAETSS